MSLWDTPVRPARLHSKRVKLSDKELRQLKKEIERELEKPEHQFKERKPSLRSLLAVYD